MSKCAECGCQASAGWALYCVKCSEQQVDWEAVAADQSMTIAMMKQREWVGLTNADYKALEVETLANNMSYREVLMWADKRLKEKNHA
jgi:hypothetical protein